MSELSRKIQMAQVEAGEAAVVESLRAKGLLPDDASAGQAIWRAALLQAARDICPYCGGRAVAFFSSADGPNEARNFTHQHRIDGYAAALCKASAIYSRLALPNPPETS